MGAPGAQLEDELVRRGRRQEVLVAVGARRREHTALDGVGRAQLLAVELGLDDGVLAAGADDAEDVGLGGAPGAGGDADAGARGAHAGDECVLVPRCRLGALADAKAQAPQAGDLARQILGRLAGVGFQIVLAGQHRIAVAAEAGVQADADAARGRHGHQIVEGGDVLLALDRRHAHVGKSGAGGEVQQRVGEDRAVQAVHAVQVQKVDARREEQVQVLAPVVAVQEVPGCLFRLPQEEERIGGANRQHGRAGQGRRHWQCRGAAGLDAFGQLLCAVQRAGGVAADDVRGGADGDDDERLRARVDGLSDLGQRGARRGIVDGQHGDVGDHAGAAQRAGQLAASEADGLGGLAAGGAPAQRRRRGGGRRGQKWIGGRRSGVRCRRCAADEQTDRGEYEHRTAKATHGQIRVPDVSLCVGNLPTVGDAH